MDGPMSKRDYLINHFLVAMPALSDETFGKSVIYVYEHTKQGAMGVVINKPMQINLGSVLKHLGIVIKNEDLITLPVLMGGPVGQEHGFILYQDPKPSKTTHNKIELSASKDMLQQIASGKGPSDFLVTLGYASWTSGQLEAEIAHNDWLIVPADSQLLFNSNIHERWHLAAQTIGVDMNKISSFVGHA